jgi:hypothetical protein
MTGTRDPDDGSWSDRFVEYLASAKNITGCLFGLVGLVLFFTGVIGAIWPVVVAALYVAGALIAPARPARSLLGGTFDAGGVRSSLKSLRREVHGRVPGDVEARVDAIAKTIDSILPKVRALGPGSEDVFILQRTATDYLPTTVRSYLELPRAYADTHPVKDGKTARQLVSEQLDLLSKEMNEVAEAVNRRDLDRLLAQGRFLEERFGRPALSIEPEEPPDPDDRAG